MTSTDFWRERQSPSLADFEAMAAEAWARLPQPFKDACGSVTIRVEDFATDEILDSLGIDSPFDLMGLYHGVSLDQKSVTDPQRMPDLVFLYRRAILDQWAETEDTLGHLVTHVLVHEIGHHFGLSDDDMEAIEQSAASS